MKLIKTKSGELYIGRVPSLDELANSGGFDIIWNLAKEFEWFQSIELEYANKVILGNINDYETPELIHFKLQLQVVVQCLNAGGKVLVHCFGGRGRTGMALACIKNSLEGMSVKDSLAFTKTACNGPETNAQIEFVKTVCKGNKEMSNKSSAAGGISLGGLLAVILSWSVNHSILWCILHFFCSWFYVIYYAITFA
jgi:hypothetical protein